MVSTADPTLLCDTALAELVRAKTIVAQSLSGDDFATLRNRFGDELRTARYVMFLVMRAFNSVV